MQEPEQQASKDEGKQLALKNSVVAGSPGLWPRVRRLLVFQVKLYIDAFRDILLSPLSALAVLLDIVQNNDEEKSHYARLLRWGRSTEQAINLFEQHDPQGRDRKTVDGLIRDVEDKLSR